MAGVDLILARDGRWVVLEVNDHPSGVASGSSPAHDGAHDPGVAAAIAEALVARLRGDAVCLLLPDAYRLTAGARSVQCLDLPAERASDPHVGHTVADFNEIAAEVRRRGADVVLSDLGGVALDGDRVVLADGAEAGVLYRRAWFPLRNVTTTVVNDVRMRPLCVDKRRTAEVLRAAGAGALPADPGDGSPDRWVIAKPRFGSASRGVVRLRAGHPSVAGLARAPRYVVQEWIEPSTFRSSGHDYYYDVRVYLVDGVPIRRMARLAASPCRDSSFSGSTLAWLTTTGARLPLVAGSTPRNDAVVLSQRTIDELDALCSTVVATLDAAAADVSYDEIRALLPKSVVRAAGGLRVRYRELPAGESLAACAGSGP